MRLPKDVIHQMCLPGGGWRSKYPRPTIIVPAYASPPVSWCGPFSQFPAVEIPRGNLTFEEYRHYCGSVQETAGFSQCRVCLKVLMTKEGRKTHPKERGCCKLFATAVKALLPRKQCVVCQMATVNQKWGVPLCTFSSVTQCQRHWAFCDIQPILLRKELLIAYSERSDKSVEIQRLSR